MSITPYKTPIGHETGQKRVGPCINMCPGCQGRHQMINIEKLSYRLSRKYLGQRYTKPQTFWSITSSKYRNVEFNFVSCSNLRRSLGIMYHMLIHGPTSFWPFWCPIGSFIRGFSHPTSHSGLRESEYSSNKSKVTLHEFTFNFCFIAAILIFFCPLITISYEFFRAQFTGKRKSMSIAAIKQKLKENSYAQQHLFYCCYTHFFRLPVNHDFVRVLSGTKPSFTGKRKKMSIAAIKQKLLCMSFRTYMSNFGS